MKILNIISQKPYATGSGVYLSEIMKQFHFLGHTQALVCGISKNDDNFIEYKKSINSKIYPVLFNSDCIPFDIFGMSDTMPYNSRQFKNMTHNEKNTYEKEFLKTIEKAINEFQPDLIICHHLYFVTSLVIENFPDKNIVAICHGTCIRQLENIDFEKERIIKNIKKIKTIFALQEVQKNDIMRIFDISKDNIYVIGNGYNPNIFYKKHQDLSNQKNINEEIKIAYAGKISKSKGIKSLINATYKINHQLEINLAGGSGNNVEFEEIKSLASKSPHKINFLGHKTQHELSNLYSKCNLFVFPSFYEGLGLSIIEAMACGLDIVVSNTDGLKDWIYSKIKNPPIIFVDLPRMKNVDEPYEEDIPIYEQNLINAINTQIQNIKLKNYNKNDIDMTEFSWLKISEIIIEKSYL